MRTGLVMLVLLAHPGLHGGVGVGAPGAHTTSPGAVGAGAFGAASHAAPMDGAGLSGTGAPPGADAVFHLSPGAYPMEEQGAGRVLTGVHETAGGKLSYRLYLPSELPGGGRPALVVALHGCTQDADDFARGTELDARAEEGRFLVLYPEQSETRNQGRCWNWYLAAEQRREGTEVGLLAGLVRSVLDTHGADASRVYLLGMSAGGALAQILAATHPELFAALAVHSATSFAAATDLEQAIAALKSGGPAPAETARAIVEAMGERLRPVPVIVVHGTGDAVVAPVNGEQVAAQWAAAWTEARRIAGPAAALHEHAERVDGSDGVRPHRVTRWTVPGGGAVVERWEVEGLGHAWSGGDPAGSYTDREGPSSARLILDFLFRHRRGA